MLCETRSKPYTCDPPFYVCPGLSREAPGGSGGVFRRRAPSSLCPSGRQPSRPRSDSLAAPSPNTRSTSLPLVRSLSMRLFLVKNFIAATKIFRSFLLSRLLILPSRNFSAGILQTFGDLVRNSFHAEIELCFFGDVGPLPLGVSFREPFCKRWRRPCTALEPNGWFCDSARQTRLLADQLTGHLDGPSVPISASHA